MAGAVLLRALDLGFVRVVQGPARADGDHVAFAWRDIDGLSPEDERYGWHDIAAKLGTAEKFVREHVSLFDPLVTYAGLDARDKTEPTGKDWLEPGRMGWFGHSEATPASRKVFAQAFRDRILKGDPDDVLVCVDCHI